MAQEQQAVQQDAPEQVGKVFILYGSVVAIGSDGMSRQLAPGSPVFAQEQIVTGPDGSVSIVFAQSGDQLDLGRMSQVVLDQDVFGGVTPQELADQITEVEAVQEALLAGDFDPSQELEPPAAGPVDGGEGGGGHPYVTFAQTGMEVTPDSGAETTGVGLSFVEPAEVDILPVDEPQTEPVADTNAQPVAEVVATSTPNLTVVPPPQEEGNLVPSARPEQAEIVEYTTGDAVDGGVYTVTGNLLDNDTQGDGVLVVVSIVIGDITYTIPNQGSVTHLTPLGGELTVSSDGSYSYTILASVLHETNGQGDGIADAEEFYYTIADEDGDTASSTLTVNILDTAPEALDDSNEVAEGGSVTGNLIFGRFENGSFQGEDQQSADQGLHVISITVDGQTYAIGQNGSVTVEGLLDGSTLTVYSNGDYVYTAPDDVDNPVDARGHGVPVEDICQYTVADNDGSLSTATLTISVLDDQPHLTVTGSQVDESGLGSGTNPGSGAESTSGQFDIDVDGPYSLSVSGTAITSDGTTITGSHGTLVVNLDGSWQYTLDTAYEHTTGAGVTGVDDVASGEDFTVSVVEDGGASAPLTGTLEIQILDDGPRAVDEATLLVEEGDQDNDGINNQVSGNVLANDSSGADGGTGSSGALQVTAVLIDGTSYDLTGGTVDVTTGLGGNLQITSDGTYTYTAPDSVNNSAGNPTETFTYTITDGDGDQSQADLTVVITDTAPQIQDVSGISVFFRNETAGYDNVVGVYEVDATGAPSQPHLIVGSTDDYIGDTGDEMVFSSTDASVKLFLVPNAANALAGIDDSDLRFTVNTDGSYSLQYYSGGIWHTRSTFFMDQAFNSDGVAHFAEISEDRSLGNMATQPLGAAEQTTEEIELSAAGSGHEQYIGIEDLAGGGDGDYDDATLFGEQVLGVSESGLVGGSFAGTAVTSVGGNLLDDGNIVASPDGGLRITIDGQTLELDGDGDTLDITTASGQTLTLSDNGDWRYSLNQAVEHPGAGLEDHADSVTESFEIYVADGDGSAAAAPINLAVNIYDDPDVQVSPAVVSPAMAEAPQVITEDVVQAPEDDEPAAGAGKEEDPAAHQDNAGAESSGAPATGEDDEEGGGEEEAGSAQDEGEEADAEADAAGADAESDGDLDPGLGQGDAADDDGDIAEQDGGVADQDGGFLQEGGDDTLFADEGDQGGGEDVDAGGGDLDVAADAGGQDIDDLVPPPESMV